MIIYVSTNKINNLLEEAQLNQKITLPSLESLTLGLSGFKAEAKVGGSDDNIGYKLKKALKYLERCKRIEDLTDDCVFSELNFYRCFASIHFNRVVDAMTGKVIRFRKNCINEDTLCVFRADINNCHFSELLLTCSAKNFGFCFESPIFSHSYVYRFFNSHHLVPVELIFTVTEVDGDKKIIYGSPLIIMR